MPIMQLFSKMKKYLLKKGRNLFYFGKHNLNGQYVSDFVLVYGTALASKESNLISGIIY